MANSVIIDGQEFIESDETVNDNEKTVVDDNIVEGEHVILKELREEAKMSVSMQKLFDNIHQTMTLFQDPPLLDCTMITKLPSGREIVIRTNRVYLWDIPILRSRYPEISGKKRYVTIRFPDMSLYSFMWLYFTIKRGLLAFSSCHKGIEDNLMEYLAVAMDELNWFSERNICAYMSRVGCEMVWTNISNNVIYSFIPDFNNSVDSTTEKIVLFVIRNLQTMRSIVSIGLYPRWLIYGRLISRHMIEKLTIKYAFDIINQYKRQSIPNISIYPFIFEWLNMHSDIKESECKTITQYLELDKFDIISQEPLINHLQDTKSLPLTKFFFLSLRYHYKLLTNKEENNSINVPNQLNSPVPKMPLLAPNTKLTPLEPPKTSEPKQQKRKDRD